MLRPTVDESVWLVVWIVSVIQNEPDAKFTSGFLDRQSLPIKGFE